MELLPCPFCGGTPVLRDFGANRHHIHCQKCPARLGATWSIDETPEFLITAWNTRSGREWISVEEKIPKEGDKIFAVNQNGGIVEREVVSYLIKMFKHFYTHWMHKEIPSPPKSQVQGDKE